MNRESYLLWSCINLNSNIFVLLTFFRLNKIAVLADVEKAFLQIALSEKDREAVRFLFPHNGKVKDESMKIETFRFKRVLFGVNASPFLLAATIKKHLESYLKVLGLSWEVKMNNLCMNINNLLEFLKQKKCTKRFILQTSGRIFDPIGLQTPNTIRIKCLFQELWKEKLS